MKNYHYPSNFVLPERALKGISGNIKIAIFCFFCFEKISINSSWKDFFDTHCMIYHTYVKIPSFLSIIHCDSQKADLRV